MYRFIENKLIEWKERPNRKPLILRGMRQVGKTYSVTAFGAAYFSGAVHKIDFERRNDLCPLFEQNLDVKRIVSEIELVLDIRIVPGRDLLFFDEIQSCPKALMSLRYFYEDMPELHLIAAGSLLDFTLKDISFPVGRVQFMEMYPLSFQEFLLAEGREQAAAFISAPDPKPSPAIHKMLLDEVRKYFFVGGMPQCVKNYESSGKFQIVFDTQRELIDAFRQDFSHYAPYADKRCLDAVLVNSAKSVGRQIIYSKLADGFSGPTIKKAFDLLVNARLIHPAPVSGVGIPLGASASARKTKALIADIGLMQNLSGVRRGEEFFKKELLKIYNGALAEQFVGQEILASGNRDIFFWSRNAKNSTAEVDYLIEKAGTVYPIEVKSGPAGKLKSMHLLLQTYKNIPYGYVCSTAPAGDLPEQRLRFVPLYLAGNTFRGL